MARLHKRLKSEGELVETSYCLYVNNVEPIYFNSRVALQDYLKEFRSHTDIFHLQIFRIETYSLIS